MSVFSRLFELLLIATFITGIIIISNLFILVDFVDGLEAAGILQHCASQPDVFQQKE